MRVIHVLDHFLPKQSGYVYRTLGLIGAQRRAGVDVHLLSTPRQGETEHTQETFGEWTIHRTPVPKTSHLPILKEAAEVKATKGQLERLIADIQPDIIHCHSPVLTAFAALTLPKPRPKIVYEIRAFWEDAAATFGTSHPLGPRYWLTRQAENRAVNQADAVITICQGLKDDLVKRGVKDDKITIIGNAVNTNDFTYPLDRDQALASQLGIQDKRVLGFAGSFYHYEGLDLLIQALPQIRASGHDAVILLVGGGPEEDNLKAQAKKLGIEEHVIFTGRVPHSDVEKYTSVMDFNVFPRRASRLTDLVTPLKPLESMAMGKPVLASNVGGHKELIQDGETGHLFPADDVSAIAEAAIQQLSAHSDTMKTVKNGRDYVTNIRNWDQTAAPYGPLYQRLTKPA